ncbi:MAG: N-acetylmuramoyl-L-alanine amidase [Chloroflexi bacterium]|nr:MAG: N-acetylmuramoyl-L-alanine amidase [Chloroflexota bacterium]
MGDRYLTDLTDVLRAAGLPVIELDGWRTRARGSGGYDPGKPTHVMVHHTASTPSSSGEGDAWYCAEGDEDAPLSNLCLDRDGVWWVLAAGATNTNGKGGPLDGVPADSMNTYAIGVEANGGYGETWPDAQTDSYLAGVAALCDHYGLAYVRGHAEWAPDRKVDPAGPSPWATGNSTWDMDDFRHDLSEEADVALSDKDIDRIAARVWSYPAAGEGSKATRWFLEHAYGIVRRYLGGYQDDSPLPEPTMLQQIHDNTR